MFCTSFSNLLTNSAAIGFSQTKSCCRMWSTNAIIFFLASFKLFVVWSVWVEFDAFSILLCNFFMVGERNNEFSWHRLISVSTHTCSLPKEICFDCCGVCIVTISPSFEENSHVNNFVWSSFSPDKFRCKEDICLAFCGVENATRSVYHCMWSSSLMPSLVPLCLLCRVWCLVLLRRIQRQSQSNLTCPLWEPTYNHC
jgi:hypothetical protein